MGCICSKGSSEADDDAIHRDGKGSKKLSKIFSTVSKKSEFVVVRDTIGRANGRARTLSSHGSSLSKAAGGPLEVGIKKDTPPPLAVVLEKTAKLSHQRRATIDAGASGREQNMRIPIVPNGVEGELVAAGWPSWLSSVAAEAVRGWLPRKADSFEKLNKIGQGTYSNVYKARDLETGKIVAIKKVRFVYMDPESVRFMAREIYILRRLDHPNVIKLEGLIASRSSSSLYLVFEYIEHDLAGLSAIHGSKFTEPQVKCYMKQLFLGIEHCHNRGVLHRDIKGSNLLIDNNGTLRIADFGLATFFNPGVKQSLTSRVVTLWYRPPELLLGATEYGVAVDLWSSGCILAELLAGKPIMPGRTEVEQLHKIFKLCGSPADDYWRRSKLTHATIFKPQHPYRRCLAETFKDFPSSGLSLLDILLSLDPEQRGTSTSALKSEFFTTPPFPCDPSSLPKYQPSKEMDAKMREEARKIKDVTANGHNGEPSSRKSNAKLSTRLNVNFNGSSEKQMEQQARGNKNFNTDEDERSTNNPPTRHGTKSIYHSGPLYPDNTRGSSLHGTARFKEDELFPANAPYRQGAGLKTQRSCMPRSGFEVSNVSGFATARAVAKSDNHRNDVSDHVWPVQTFGKIYNGLDEAESAGKHKWAHTLLDRPASSHKKAVEVSGKEPTMNYAPKKNRIHYSGPLFPPRGNLDEMLKEHEKQIQHAVRKARLDRAKTKKDLG